MTNKAFILDFDLLKEHNLSINEFLALIDLENYKNSELLTTLEEKQFIKIIDNEILLRQNGNLLLDLITIEKINAKSSKVIVKKSERIINNELDSFIDEFRNKWKGLKPGSMGSLSACRDKMSRWMKENTKYTPQQILKAVDIYLNSLDNYQYLQQADYFIYKKDAHGESSRLSAFIDEVDNYVDNNWTSKLN
jgi:hypothetical protein